MCTARNAPINSQEGMKNKIDPRSFKSGQVTSLSSIICKRFKKEVIHHYGGVADDFLNKPYVVYAN